MWNKCENLDTSFESSDTTTEHFNMCIVSVPLVHSRTSDRIFLSEITVSGVKPLSYRVNLCKYSPSLCVNLYFYQVCFVVRYCSTNHECIKTDLLFFELLQWTNKQAFTRHTAAVLIQAVLIVYRPELPLDLIGNPTDWGLSDFVIGIVAWCQ